MRVFVSVTSRPPNPLPGGSRILSRRPNMVEQRENIRIQTSSTTPPAGGYNPFFAKARLSFFICKKSFVALERLLPGSKCRERDRGIERQGEMERQGGGGNIYVQAIYKLLESTFQMLQLRDNDEETFEVYNGEKTITIKEGIKLACLLSHLNISLHALPFFFPPILFP